MEAQTTSNSPTWDQSLQQREEKKQPPSALPTPQEQDTNKDSELETAAREEQDYITGFKLVLVLVSITLVAFLMMLDMSIIATVKHHQEFSTVETSFGS
jgi:hypothetical protein